MRRREGGPLRYTLTPWKGRPRDPVLSRSPFNRSNVDIGTLLPRNHDSFDSFQSLEAMLQVWWLHGYSHDSLRSPPPTTSTLILDGGEGSFFQQPYLTLSKHTHPSLPPSICGVTRKVALEWMEWISNEESSSWEMKLISISALLHQFTRVPPLRESNRALNCRELCPTLQTIRKHLFKSSQVLGSWKQPTMSL